MSKEKSLELDRLVFFSDAVVAIAITLLALDLRIEKPAGGTLSFHDIWEVWPKFAAFFLSFVLIAVFWKVHHKFFSHIREIDGKLLWFNIWWLLFIVMLPFTTTLLSNYSMQKVSVFVYSVNTLLITIFQNTIWDYASTKKDFLKETVFPKIIYDYRVDCNVAMVNALLAIGVSFISPIAAFVVLCLRPVMMRGFRMIYPGKRFMT